MNYILDWLGATDEPLRTVIGAGVIIALTILASLAVRIALGIVGIRLAAQTKTDLDDRLIQAIRRPLYRLVYLLGLIALIDYFKKLSEEALGPKFFVILDGVTFSIGVLIVGSLLLRVIETMVEWYVGRVAQSTGSKVEEEFVPLIDRIAKIVIYSLAILIVLDHFKVDVKGLLAVLGVGSLAVALAAQDTIANMIGGFTLMIDRPVRVGDWLKLPSNQVCMVQQIGIRSTKLKTLDNTLFIVPNAELMKSTIHNLSYPSPEVVISIEVGVAYDSNIDVVKAAMLEEAGSHPQVLKDPPPIFRVREFGESGVTVLLACHIGTFTQQYIVASDLREKILRRFRADKIVIPYPQRVVHMSSGGKQVEQ